MASQQPTYQAYTVIKREGQEDYWLNVGSAWLHGDGQGLNVLLQALPIDGKIVLRPPKSDTKEDTTQSAQQTVREANDRRRTTRRDK